MPKYDCEDPVQVASVMGMSVSLDLLVDMYPIPTTREALVRDLIDLEAARFLKASEVPGTWMITQVLHFLYMHTTQKMQKQQQQTADSSLAVWHAAVWACMHASTVCKGMNRISQDG